MWPPAADESSSFEKLMQHDRSLKLVSLLFARSLNETGDEFHEDELMQQLVRMSPNIREINEMYLTERGIRSH
jgi:hypothetical protein